MLNTLPLFFFLFWVRREEEHKLIALLFYSHKINNNNNCITFSFFGKPQNYYFHTLLYLTTQKIRATASIHAKFLSILQEKTYFFLFYILIFLQNTHISLSILSSILFK